jgi:hypothetical protein
MKRVALAVALLAFVSPALADENTDAARDFLVTCGKRLPETKQTVQVLKTEGWRYESSDGNFHFYSQNGRRVIAATSVTSSAQQGCLSAVARLSDDGAVAIGKATAKALGLAPTKEQLPSGILAIWEGKLNGQNVGLAAMPSDDFGFIRGASLVLVQE